jgi:hypothetical protein
MANGTITLTASGKLPSYLNGRIVWSSTSNGTAANISSVTAQLQISRNSSVATSGTWYGSFTVGGASKQISYYTSVGSSWVTIDTVTATVTHNADGSGSCYIYAVLNGPTETSMEGTYVSGSATVTLDAIARYASLVSVTSFTDEGNPVISYSNPAGAAVDSLQACISLDGSTAKIGYKDVPKTGTSYTFPLTESERNTLRSATPNSSTLNVYVLLKTVIGSGSGVVSAAAQMNIVNANPTISPSVIDTNSATVNITGNSAILVANRSTAKVTINAAPKKYATVVSQRVEHGTQVLTADGTLAVTNNPIKITVTDSRGNSATHTAPNAIVPYFNPTCSISNNIPATDGTFSLVVSGLFFNGSIGKTSNYSITVQYRRKTAGGSYGNWITFGSVTKSGHGYTATANLTGLDYQTSYTFQARVIDKLHPDGVESSEKVVISQPVFDWGKSDFQFNVPVSIPSEILSYKGEVTSESNLQTLLANELNTMTLGSKKTIAASLSFGVHGGGYYIIDLYKMAFDGYAYADASNYSNLWMRYSLVNNVWTPEEWLNPPMVVGTEYRTTERYNGKPVYAKLVNFGTLPNSSYKDVSFYSNTTSRPISVVGQCGANYNSLHMAIPSSSNGVDIYAVNYSAIRSITTHDASGQYARALVKYWKTTD